MTTVCTTNWEGMMDFYCRVLGMNTDHSDFRYILSLKGLNTEICLQRVEDEVEQEVIGEIHLETDEEGIGRFLENRDSTPFEIRTMGSLVELIISDPDGNVLSINQEEPELSQAA